MAEAKGTPDRWRESVAMVPRYESWIGSLGVPVHRAYYIEDLREIEVGPWDQLECNAAFVVLNTQG